jgi:hypothetical protein
MKIQISKRIEAKRQIKRLLSWTLVGLNHEPHKSKPKDKMVKKKKKSQADDLNVVYKGREI